MVWFSKSRCRSVVAGALAEGLLLGRLNADNHQLLGAESSWMRCGCMRRSKMSRRPCCTSCSGSNTRSIFYCASRPSLLCAAAVCSGGASTHDLARFGVVGEHSPAAGGTGCSRSINPALPQPLKIPCVIAGQRIIDDSHATQLRFVGLSDASWTCWRSLFFGTIVAW